MAQQTALEQLIKMIDFEISMLEMDAGNCVEWSMSVMFGTLKKIKTEAEQAKQMEREQMESTCVEVIERILDKLEKGENTNSQDVFNQYYTQTYGK